MMDKPVSGESCAILVGFCSEKLPKVSKERVLDMITSTWGGPGQSLSGSVLTCVSCV